MTLRERIRRQVQDNARKRLWRELDRALASGLTTQDLHEGTDIVAGIRRERDAEQTGPTA